MPRLDPQRAEDDGPIPAPRPERGGRLSTHAPRRREAHRRSEFPTAPVGREQAGAASASGPVTASWRRALAAGLVCFAVWLLLDAPTLLQSAQAGPLGTRRSVAMAVLRPIADVSRVMGLSRIVAGADRVIGRSGGGVVQVAGPPVHIRRPTGRPHHVDVADSPRSSQTTVVTVPDGLPPVPPPSAAAPLRLLVVGDSLGIDFGQALVDQLAASGVVNAVLDGHIDTGLSRPDYFNWPAELAADLARYQPEALVIFIGANDPQNFIENGTALPYGTPAWSQAYGRRVGSFMTASTATGAHVLWVGMPPMADPGLDAKMQALNDIDETQAYLHRGVTFFASWPVLSDPQGNYTAFLPDASGNEVEVREPDGTHISAAGAQRLSQAAIAAMDHAWGLHL
jgi:uncharacterized protein